MNNKTNNIAYFHLPGLFEFTAFYDTFLKIYNEEQYKFNDWIKIECLYGNPSHCLWGGGRQRLNSFDEQDVLGVVQKYNMKSALTFSNLLLEKKHLVDPFCNYLCELFYNDQNYIIVNSSILEEYIQLHYPLYNLISSTTKCLSNIEETNCELLNKNYSLICLDYNYNNNFTILDNIIFKNKCELLINPVCAPNCPRRKEHYIFASKWYLHQLTLEEKMINFSCEHMSNPFYKVQQSPCFISKEAIYNTYLPMGFSHFKIEGRTLRDQDVVEILLYYLVKPEYQLEIRERIYGM